MTRGAAPPIAPEHLERFRDLVREQSGIDLPSQRLPELERAVRKVMEETEEPDPGRLASLLDDRSDDLAGLESLVGHITVGETYFFRHPQQFEAVERWILPELVDARRDVRRLRVWSAGCATGEEPFSSAILLDRIAPTLGGWNTTIVATDIHRGALETARRGRYRPWSFRGIPARVLQTYFDPVGSEFEISPRLRDMVRFEHHNLIEDPHPTLLLDANAVDLILCRNVLMYLTPDAIARVGDRLVASLADGGWLLLGPSDPRPSALEGLTRHLLGDTVIAYRKESRRALGPHRPEPRLRRSAPVRPCRRRRCATRTPRPNAAPTPKGRRTRGHRPMPRRSAPRRRPWPDWETWKRRNGASAWRWTSIPCSRSPTTSTASSSTSRETPRARWAPFAAARTWIPDPRSATWLSPACTAAWVDRIALFASWRLSASSSPAAPPTSSCRAATG